MSPVLLTLCCALLGASLAQTQCMQSDADCIDHDGARGYCERAVTDTNREVFVCIRRDTNQCGNHHCPQGFRCEVSQSPGCDSSDECNAVNCCSMPEADRSECCQQFACDDMGEPTRDAPCQTEFQCVPERTEVRCGHDLCDPESQECVTDEACVADLNNDRANEPSDIDAQCSRCVQRRQCGRDYCGRHERCVQQSQCAANNPEDCVVEARCEPVQTCRDGTVCNPGTECRSDTNHCRSDEQNMADVDAGEDPSCEPNYYCHRVSTCGDAVCPAGLVCRDQQCVFDGLPTVCSYRSQPCINLRTGSQGICSPRNADTDPDLLVDMRAELYCADPNCGNSVCGDNQECVHECLQTPVNPLPGPDGEPDERNDEPNVDQACVAVSYCRQRFYCGDRNCGEDETCDSYEVRVTANGEECSDERNSENDNECYEDIRYRCVPRDNEFECSFKFQQCRRNRRDGYCLQHFGDVQPSPEPGQDPDEAPAGEFYCFLPPLANFCGDADTICSANESCEMECFGDDGEPTDERNGNAEQCRGRCVPKRHNCGNTWCKDDERCVQRRSEACDEQTQGDECPLENYCVSYNDCHCEDGYVCESRQSCFFAHDERHDGQADESNGEPHPDGIAHMCLEEKVCVRQGGEECNDVGARCSNDGVNGVCREKEHDELYCHISNQQQCGNDVCGDDEVCEVGTPECEDFDEDSLPDFCRENPEGMDDEEWRELCHSNFLPRCSVSQRCVKRVARCEVDGFCTIDGRIGHCELRIVDEDECTDVPDDVAAEESEEERNERRRRCVEQFQCVALNDECDVGAACKLGDGVVGKCVEESVSLCNQWFGADPRHHDEEHDGDEAHGDDHDHGHDEEHDGEARGDHACEEITRHVCRPRGNDLCTDLCGEGASGCELIRDPTIYGLPSDLGVRFDDQGNLVEGDADEEGQRADEEAERRDEEERESHDDDIDHVRRSDDGQIASCRCKDNYWGSRCQHQHSAGCDRCDGECIIDICWRKLEHGLCRPTGDGQEACICTGGYTGDKCDQKDDASETQVVLTVYFHPRTNLGTAIGVVRDLLDDESLDVVLVNQGNVVKAQVTSDDQMLSDELRERIAQAAEALRERQDVISAEEFSGENPIIDNPPTAPAATVLFSSTVLAVAALFTF